MRKIIHIDMDAFYASVEQRDAPELRGRPVAVGYAGQRGVVMTASYEARKFGVGSAMPSRMALQRCPELIFIRPRMDVYRGISREVRTLFQRYTELVEPLSLDEAYLDVTQAKQGPASATLLATAILKGIHALTGLTASAGVASNKFLAKLASGYDKPAGLTVITPQEAPAFIARLPVEAFHGVGRVTARKLHALNIHTGADLRRASKDTLQAQFGKHGLHFWQIARGEDQRPVEPHRAHKSISAETTFDTDLLRVDLLLDELPRLCRQVAQQLEHRLTAGGVVIKLKYANHTIITRRQTLVGRFNDEATLLETASYILRRRVDLAMPVRLLGVGVFDLATDKGVVQPGLFC